MHRNASKEARQNCVIYREAGSVITETFLPMGWFRNPVFIRGGSQTLNGRIVTWSFDKSVNGSVLIPAPASVSKCFLEGFDALAGELSEDRIQLSCKLSPYQSTRIAVA
jgi:hypothetical protein